MLTISVHKNRIIPVKELFFDIKFTEGMIFLKALGIWLLLAVLAIINGIVRNEIILPATGQQNAHIISTIIFLIVSLL